LNGEKVLFAVAVGRAERLDRLPGAWTAARAMVDWAEAAGYRRFLVDDEDKTPVTIARLRETFQPVLEAPELVEHLIFYFAGHGFSRHAHDQVLLLSDWRSDTNETIAVRLLHRRLSQYSVRRFTRIIDACSSLPGVDTDDVAGGDLFRTGDDRDNVADQDVFQAAVHGRLAYMLRGDANAAPVCLYSAVLMQALAGIEPAEGAATRDAVRSADIARHLRTSFATIAERYGVLKKDQTPDWTSSFLAPDDVYATLPLAFTPPSLPEPRAAIAQRVRDIEAELPQAPQSHRAEQAFEQIAATLDSTIRTHDMLARSQSGLRVVAKMVGRAVDRVTDLADWPARRQRRLAAIEAALQPAKREPARAARALGALVGGTSEQRIAAVAGVWTLRAAGTPEPQLVRSDDRVLAIGLPGGRVVPHHALAECTTDLYLDVTAADGGALALDWRPAERATEDSTAMLTFLLALADDRLAFGQATEAPAEAGIARLVACRPMEAVIRAFLADAAGNRRAVEAVVQGFKAVRGAVPFDLALVAGIDDPGQVTGRFPLLPAGWQLLPFARLPVHPALADLAAGLVPAYPFATLQGASAERFLALIQAGEI
jgi:hypothetical protein